MAHSRYDCNLGCPVEAALEVIGGKKLEVLLTVGAGDISELVLPLRDALVC